MGSEVVCPACANTEWNALPRTLRLREDDPNVLRGGGVAVTGFSCTSCGFLRLHVGEKQDAAPGDS